MEQLNQVPEEYRKQKEKARLQIETYSLEDIRSAYKGVVVAVGGPPHSGKSVFLAELYRQLLEERSSEVFLQRACPDGEGMWSAESKPELVKEIRRKGSFSPEFMNFTLKSIESLGKNFPIVLLDLGGRRTAENAEILKRSTHQIILSSKKEEIQEWVDFAQAEGCPTMGVFDSALVHDEAGQLDISVRSDVDTTEYPIRGGMLNLDRDLGNAPYQDAIDTLAHWMIQEVDRHREETALQNQNINK